MSYFPRVLIINGIAFGDHSATSITLGNLFRGWPARNLALVHYDPIASSPGGDICGYVYEVSAADVPLDGLLRKLFLKGSPLPPAGKRATGERNSVRQRGHFLPSFWRAASAWADLLPVKPPARLWRIVDEFVPEVIYSMLGSARIAGLAERISRYCDAPVVPHFMDDWYSTQYRGFWTSIPRSVLLSKVSRIVRKAPVGLAIGPAMAAEYHRRFGLKFIECMNCVDVPAQFPVPVRSQRDPIKVLFIGGLHLGRAKMLSDVAEVLTKLKEEGLDIVCEVHTSAREIANYSSAFASSPVIRFNGPLSDERLPVATAAADILLHLDSFEEPSRTYLRYSMSTKLPLYFASGRPILVYGPPELASSQYVANSRAGIVVSRRDAASLATAIRSLALAPALREELGRNSWTKARESHHGDAVRERFRSALYCASHFQSENPLNIERSHGGIA